MATYRVLFDVNAAEEAVAAAEFIAQEAPLNAARWYEGLEKRISALSKYPKRCPIAPESEFLGTELRHLIYHSHRIIFWIDERNKVVRILHVRHAAQKAISEPEREDEDA